MIVIIENRASAITETRATRRAAELPELKMKDELDSADRIPLAFLLG
jgi:hypothetical protein